MVQMESAFRSLTLSFVLVIVNAINVDNALVILLACMALDRNPIVGRSTIEGSLTLSALQ